MFSRCLHVMTPYDILPSIKTLLNFIYYICRVNIKVLWHCIMISHIQTPWKLLGFYQTEEGIWPDFADFKPHLLYTRVLPVLLLFLSANVRGPVRFKAPHELWNPQSKAVPGKFHKYGGHSKCNCLQDWDNFHRSLPGRANCPTNVKSLI